MKNVTGIMLLVFVIATMAISKESYSQAYKKLLELRGDFDRVELEERLVPPTESSDALPDLFWEWSPEPRWLSGRNWNAATFFGSIDFGENFFGSTLSENEYVPVEIRFNSAETTYCQTYRRDLGYVASGPGVFRGSAWDISDPNNPRRLNICFVENDDGTGVKPPNLLWDPDYFPGEGREYVFIMLSDYDGSGTSYNDANFGPTADVILGWWPSLEDGASFFDSDPAALSIHFAYIRGLYATPGDGSATLRWSLEDQSAAQLNIYGGTSPSPNTIVASVDVATTIYEHSGLINGSTYYYWVEGVSGTGELLYRSAEVSVEPQVVSSNMTLTGALHPYERYGDIWGYTTNGREYALLCARNDGLSIIDVTDPIPVEVGFVSGLSDAKDVKVYDHYAILINEGDVAQVIDIADPANPVQVTTIDFSLVVGSNGAHNCYVDGQYLYVVGNHAGGGMLIYDMINPLSPTFVGRFEPFYYHDLYVRNDTAYAAGIYGNGVDIIDVSNKSQPALLARFNYPGSGAHNCWTTEDGKFLFVGDEIGDANHTRVFDIQDLSNIDYVADYIVDPNAVTHNSYVKGDYLYVGHYTEGVRVVDVSDPANPQEVAYYDTYIPADYGTRGCWSVYPYFASGKIIASDMQTGLYVLTFDQPTGIGDTDLPQVVEQFSLAQNYPNPFNPVTTISFSLPETDFATLTIYNLSGETVATLFSEVRPAGQQNVSWQPENLPSGIYFYQLKTNTQTAAKKLVLLK